MKTYVTHIHTNGKAGGTGNARICESLLNIFELLNRRNIRYALLRGYDELAVPAPQKEIDLLVHPQDMEAFAHAARGLGYVKMLRMGYQPHHFFAKFDAQSNTLLKLDVVTDLYYGNPHRYLHWPAGKEFLARRVPLAPGYVLSPADELISLFLHGVLDKKHFRDARLVRLRELHALVETQPDLHQLAQLNLRDALGDALDWGDFSRVLNDAAPDTSINIAEFTDALNQKFPLRNAWRRLSTPLMRKLRPLGFATRHRGIWVALLAPDGGGKSTLSKALLKQPLLRAKMIYMGINVEASTVGFPTTKKLKQLIKSMESQKRPKLLVKGVKALASLNKLMEHWYRVGMGVLYSLNGRTVIFDRFVYDGYLNGKPRRLKSRLRRLLLWGFCPDADLTVFLDAPGDVLFRRKGEHSPEALEIQRQKYLRLQNQVPNFQVVDATQSPDEVLRDVLNLIWITLQHQPKK